MNEPRITIVGGGLAGTEAALQLADRGFDVDLYEMRPVRRTEAHRSERLAELVCSNTFKSERTDTPSGTLKVELELLGARLLSLARRARVPGGHALALDREIFGDLVTREIEAHDRIRLIREEVSEPPVDGPTLIATGPLTAPGLQEWIHSEMGDEGLYFYDAIAPSVLLDSVDTSIAFRASRYEKGDADYLNCPLDRDEYEAFVDALLGGERVPMKDFEKAAYFPGLHADRGHRRARAREPTLRAHASGGSEGPAHGTAPVGRGAAAAGDPRRHAVRARRIPDPAPLRRSEGRLPSDSRPAERRVRPPGESAPQHLPGFAATPGVPICRGASTRASGSPVR